MYPQNASYWPHPHSLTTLLLLVMFLGTLSIYGITATKSAPQDPESQPAKKVLKTLLPSHVPLKFEVKNLDSKDWIHELEIEVTNTSERPIYFLDFYITLPEIKSSSGSIVGFWIKYGRGELLDFSTPLEKDDVPFLPGKKQTFKISKGSASGWEYMKQKEGAPEPRKILVVFQQLNFGDGTGYADAGGTPVNIHKKINFNKTCVPPPANQGPQHLQTLAFASVPAKFLAGIVLCNKGL